MAVLASPPSVQKSCLWPRGAVPAHTVAGPWVQDVKQFGALAHIDHCWQIANMKAELITRFKSVAEDGGVRELVVWRVPRPVPPTHHGYKYRAVCAVDGVRGVGFDNERGRGDHCHLHGRELRYIFTTVDALADDFIAAVDAARRTP